MQHPDWLPYALGELAPAEQARVGAHVERCASCARDVAALAALRAVLPAALAAPEAEAEAARARLLARLRRVRHPLVLKQAERRRLTAALLAASVLGLLVLKSYVPLPAPLPPLPDRVHELKRQVLSRLTWDAFPRLPFAKEKSGA